MNTRRFTLQSLLALLVVSTLIFGVTSCFKQIQDHQFPNPTTFAAVQGPPVAAGLSSPIGLVEDTKGYLWVTEAGSGTASPASGRVSVITPSGTFTAITGFLSAESPEGSPEGLNHLAYRDGKLYILHGVDDALYIADVSSFVPGVTPPLSASSLTKVDIGTYVRQEHPNAPDPKDSNPYNLTFGPEGDLYITDAGGNAIVRRKKDTGVLSIYAVFPDVVGPFSGDPVPTGIVFDGTKFWVTSLTGAPFIAGIANIYHVMPNGTTGTVSVYKTGYTGLTDITLTPGGKTIVTEFGFGPPPPAAPTGRIASGDNAAVSLLSAIPTPVDILRSDMADTYYVLYYGPGLIVKLNATN
ncbi:ScyD/ScyE family protein [Larkinella humicola]|uniref:ScyD/ScyE family protein n=1 Tax=Larkinella humicola TaxID=2607654 RepID=A0A5N1J7G6_9BACT|nr:ScyD/ScyE family protein [Larkinella humicola]KAA9347130.1 ScyD/ScyE family protein [Larkinella humicola]